MQSQEKAREVSCIKHRSCVQTTSRNKNTKQDCRKSRITGSSQQEADVQIQWLRSPLEAAGEGWHVSLLLLLAERNQLDLLHTPDGAPAAHKHHGSCMNPRVTTDCV